MSWPRRMNMHRELADLEHVAAALAAETAAERAKRLYDDRRLLAAGFVSWRGYWRETRLGGIAPSLTRGQALDLVARRFQAAAAAQLRGAP